MKKIRYIAFSLLALLFGVCLVSFIPKTDTYAKTTTYEADVISGNTFLPDYAISDVVSARFSGNLLSTIIFNTNYDNGGNNFILFRIGEQSFSGYFNTIIITLDLSKYSSYSSFFCGNKVSFVISSNNKNNCIYIYNGWLCFLRNNGDITISIRNSPFNVSSYNSYYTEDSLGFFCDMNSNSYCKFNVLDFYKKNYYGDFTLFYILYCFSIDKPCYPWLFSLELPAECNCEFTLIGSDIIYSSGHIFHNIRFDIFTEIYNLGLCSFTFDVCVNSFYVDINRDIYRINNSLLLYNFDYNSGFISNVCQFSYTLKRNEDYYEVVYGERDSISDLDNSKYISFVCDEINNMIFDKYISLYFFADYNINNIKYIIEADGIYIIPGFDFNFVQYNQPLVASNGAYNYDFEKPKYVDMHFSLYPFYIPILEICQNAIIFLVFYCPIISDVLALVYLDRFIGALLQIINFVLGVPIGSFILACIGFIVYYMVLRSFMPIIYDSVGGIYHKSNYYKYNKERKQSKNDLKYQIYKDKRINKQINREIKKIGKKKR